MIRDVPGLVETRQRLSGTNEPYLPFEWFRQAGLLLMLNGALSPHGFQVAWVYPTHDFNEPVGWDLVGTGRAPIFGRLEPGVEASAKNLQLLLRPNVPIERRRRPRPKPPLELTER